MIRLILYVVGLALFSCLNRIDVRYVDHLRAFALFFEKMRANALRMMGAQIGSGSFIRAAAFITSPRRFSMGARSKIGRACELYLYEPLLIGNDVEIGSGLIVHTAEHSMDDSAKPLCKQGSRLRPVVIGSDVYIGSRVTILSGVSIGDRVVVAAGSVVVKDLPGGFVYAGTPAKPLKAVSNNSSADEGAQAHNV